MLFRRDNKPASKKGQNREKDLSSVLYVMESLKQYHTDLVEKEVASLWELNLIGTSFNGVLGETEHFQEKLQDLEHNFLSVNEASEHFVTVKDKIAQTVDQAQNEIEILKTSSLEVETHFGEMGTTFSALQDSVEQIKQRMSQIVSIANQTNILAINASIEAARAGEKGKGFAVVANQIRNLAVKSSDSVNQTTELIGRSLAAVENGVQIAGETASSLTAVVEGAKEITGSVRKISSASQNQKLILEEVVKSVDLIEGVVRSNTSTAHESALTSEQLSRQSKRLHELVNQFKLKEM